MIPPVSGLSSEEVEARRHAAGASSARRSGVRSSPRIVLTNILTLFNLINASVIGFLIVFYVRTGDHRLLLDSVGVIIVTVLNTTLAIWNEMRAVKKIRDLDLLRPRGVCVVRDGQTVTVDRAEVVRGDVVAVHTGDQISVDGTVIESHHLEVDESLLTGESAPVAMAVGDRVRAGTFCIYGGGYYCAEEVEGSTEADRITARARRYEIRSSPLLREIDLIFVLSLGVTILLAAGELWRDMEGRGLGVEGVRKISTIATSVMPEGLMFFATITFVLAMHRMAGRGALVQQINALDRLPMVDTVCIDKTGTLTTGELVVERVVPFGGRGDRDACEKLLGGFAAATAEPNATVRALERFIPAEECELLDELPFRSALKSSAVRYRSAGVVRTLLLGGFDVLLGTLDDADRAEAQRLFELEGLRGERTLLLAALDGADGPLTVESIAGMPRRPLCIVGMTDHVRDAARASLDQLRDRGVDVKILSGDAPDSVAAVLRSVGWSAEPEMILLGEELHAMPEPERAEAVRSHSIFARLTPEQKLEILRGLREKGAHTAMIGDGVNDIAALKEADVGIAMGEGSAASRQISDVVLLGDGFGVLGEIVEEGTRVINTVIAVGRLFLVKTLLVVTLSVLPWFGAFAYPLTPRRGALLSVLGVALPSYFVAAISRNKTRVIGLRRQLVPFILLSSVVLVAAALAAERLGDSIAGMHRGAIQSGMMATLAVLVVVNFLCAVVFDDRPNLRAYLLLAGGLLLLYAPLLLTTLDVVPFGWLRAFYEIDPLPVALRPGLALLTAAFALLLLLLHWLRHRWERRAARHAAAA